MKVYRYDISLFFAVVSNIVILYGSDDFHIRCDCDVQSLIYGFGQGIKSNVYHQKRAERRTFGFPQNQKSKNSACVQGGENENTS